MASRRPPPAPPQWLRVCLLAALLACGEDAVGPGPAPQVIVTPAFVDLVLGVSRQLAVTVLDADGQPVADPPLEFTSSDAARVAVTPAGLVTAQSPGEVTVTVASGAARAYAGVRALSPATLRLSPDTAAVPVGDTLVFTAEARDAAGVVVPDAPVTFESSDPAVLAVIGPAGRVRAAGMGVAQLRARSGTAADTSRIQVYGIPASVAITPDSVRLVVGSQAAITVQVRDAAGNLIPNAPVSVTSADPTVAQVTGVGGVRTVLAVGVGVTTVTAGIGGVADTIPVVGAASVELTPPFAVLAAGDTVQLTAVARDFLGNVLPGIPFTFSSSDTGVARVSGTGAVTFAGPGTARIVAEGGYGRDSSDVTAVVARTPVSGRPFGLAVSTGDAIYVTRLDAGSVVRLDPVTADSVASVAVGAAPTDVIFNAAGTRAYVTNQWSQSVSEIDPATNTELRRISIPADAYIVALAPGDSILYVSANSARTYVIRLASGAIIDSLPTGINFAVAVRDTLLYVGLPLNGRVDVYDRRTRILVRTLATGGRPAGMAFSATGDELYVADELGGLQRWATATGTSLGTVTLSPTGALGVAVQPGTGLVFAGGMQDFVHVVDPVAGTVLRSLRVGGTPRRIGFRANGDAFVANEAGWVDVVR